MKTRVIVGNSDPLEKLLGAAYVRATRKGPFLDKLDEVPGVLCSHESASYCRGYAQAMGDLGQPTSDLVLVMLHATGNTNRTYLVRDIVAFQRALEEARDRPIRTNPTPRKVMVKMLLERMTNIVKATEEHNEVARDKDKNRYRNLKALPKPVLDSKLAYVAWTNLPHGMRPQGHKMALERYTDILEREGDDVFPDDVYPEAWNLVQVREVMDS